MPHFFRFSRNARDKEPEGVEIKAEVYTVAGATPPYFYFVSIDDKGRGIGSLVVYKDGKPFASDFIPLEYGKHTMEVVVTDGNGKKFTKEEEITV